MIWYWKVLEEDSLKVALWTFSLAYQHLTLVKHEIAYHQPLMSGLKFVEYVPYKRYVDVYRYSAAVTAWMFPHLIITEKDGVTIIANHTGFTGIHNNFVSIAANFKSSEHIGCFIRVEVHNPVFNVKPFDSRCLESWQRFSTFITQLDRALSSEPDVTFGFNPR